MPRKKQEPDLTPQLEGVDIDDVPAPVAEPAMPFDPSEKTLNGQRAQALLSDPVLSAAFDAVASKYRLAWEHAPRGDIDTQRVAHASLSALKDVIGALRAFVGGGKIFAADQAAKKRNNDRNGQYE